MTRAGIKHLKSNLWNRMDGCLKDSLFQFQFEVWEKKNPNFKDGCQTSENYRDDGDDKSF